MKVSPPPILELGSDYFDVVVPAHFPEQKLRYWNEDRARKIGLSSFNNDKIKQHFCLFESLAQNLQQALALRYHGHQFGHYNPQLGDGRGFLFAQINTNNGTWKDLGTKGSGQTPYSRDGDGRLTLKGAFREALCTEMLESLGLPTSRTLCIFETGESLIRYDEPSPTRSAVLTRESLSHLRVGTFQRLAHINEPELLRKLINYTARYYFPESITAEGEKNAESIFSEIINRWAKTAAGIMVCGFVHGVLNSDNINITGELFDFGPYRFLPCYDPTFTAAYFDKTGFYCFGRQPQAIFWNLQQLAMSFQFAYPNFRAKESLQKFPELFNNWLPKLLIERLNLKFKKNLESRQDLQNLNERLLASTFQFLEKSKCKYEQFFHDLCGGYDPRRIAESPQKDIYHGSEFSDLISVLENFEISSLTRMNILNPGAAESLLIDEIETTWSSIAAEDNWDTFNKKCQKLRRIRGQHLNSFEQA